MGALAVMVLVSIPMFIAAAQQTAPPHAPNRHASPLAAPVGAHAPTSGMPAPSGLVVQLRARTGRDLFAARVLKPLGRGIYTTTAKSIDLAIPSSAPTEMGSRVAVRPGAVLEISAHASAGGVLVASGIVVLTGQVHLQ